MSVHHPKTPRKSWTDMQSGESFLEPMVEWVRREVHWLDADHWLTHFGRRPADVVVHATPDVHRDLLRELMSRGAPPFTDGQSFQLFGALVIPDTGVATDPGFEIHYKTPAELAAELVRHA